MKFDRKGLDNYITDPELETEGVWLKFPGDRKICIRRAGGANKRYLRLAQTAIKPFKRQIERGTMDPGETDRVMREVYAKSIVSDWEGIDDENGAPVPCTVENIVAFFNAFPEIFAEVLEYAGEMATFAEREIEEAQEVLGES